MGGVPKSPRPKSLHYFAKNLIKPGHSLTDKLQELYMLFSVSLIHSSEWLYPNLEPITITRCTGQVYTISRMLDYIQTVPLLLAHMVTMGKKKGYKKKSVII